MKCWKFLAIKNNEHAPEFRPNAMQECIERLGLPPVQPDVQKATYGGPGVQWSNIEVKR